MEGIKDNRPAEERMHCPPPPPPQRDFHEHMFESIPNLLGYSSQVSQEFLCTIMGSDDQ
jgi:hypothetical protein